MNNETGEPMDNLLPEVKDWAQSLGVNVNTVPEILADKNSVVIVFTISLIYIHCIQTLRIFGVDSCSNDDINIQLFTTYAKNCI